MGVGALPHRGGSAQRIGARPRCGDSAGDQLGKPAESSGIGAVRYGGSSGSSQIDRRRASPRVRSNPVARAVAAGSLRSVALTAALVMRAGRAALRDDLDRAEQ